MPRKHQQGTNPSHCPFWNYWECKIKWVKMRITNLKILEKRVPTNAGYCSFTCLSQRMQSINFYLVPHGPVYMEGVMVKRERRDQGLSTPVLSYEQNHQIWPLRCFWRSCSSLSLSSTLPPFLILLAVCQPLYWVDCRSSDPNLNIKVGHWP